MTSTFSGRNVAGWFRLVALAEAVTWVGLLVGMYFKYLGSPRTEIGVKVFGMAHGLVFIAFVVVALLGRNGVQVDGLDVVAGFAGEHRAAGQCDLPHMGGSHRPGGCGNRGRTGNVGVRHDVTDLTA